MSSLEIGATRTVSTVQVSAVQPVSNSLIATPALTTSAAPEIATSLPTDAGSAPVDEDRVAQIRQAVQSGNYPVVPQKISDALIAASLLLRKTP